MKKISLILFITLLHGHLFAQLQQLPPQTIHPTAIAIITDSITYTHAQQEILAYKQMLESKENLSAYILAANWKNPEEVKEQLLHLSNNKKTKLEGAVFIGNIPIVMVRNAQHLTSAFKMDELKYPFEESSVPSDRYYDDFSLQFRFVMKSPRQPDLFYYELTETSPQIIHSNIYTARIKSHKKGPAQYEEIAQFLNKAVAARNTTNQFTSILAYTGSGYNSESLTAWQDEKIALKELFAPAFQNANNHRFLYHTMSDQIKTSLISELQRPQTDIALFSHHGDAQIEYLCELPATNGVKSAPDSISRANTRMVPADIQNIHSQPRMIILNACYNASFHKPENIASAYLFNKGRTLVTFGNTVNVLQDKWTWEQAGLLGKGVRAGLWAQLVNTLESHIEGDPTFHFGNSPLNEMLVLQKNNTALWEEYLTKEDEVYTILALEMLYQLQGNAMVSRLATLYTTSTSCNVRMQCLNLLSSIGDSTYRNLLKIALTDSYELIRRKAADWIAKDGSNELIAPLINTALSMPDDKRVIFAVEKALVLMNDDSTVAAIKQQMGAADYLQNRDDAISLWLKKIDNNQKRTQASLNTVKNKMADTAKRYTVIRTFRNATCHKLVPDLLQIATDKTDAASVRINTLEALGWFSTSYQKEAITATCKSIIADKTDDERVKKEAQQTFSRLQQWKLY